MKVNSPDPILLSFAEWCGYNWIEVTVGNWVDPADDTFRYVKSTKELYELFLESYYDVSR